MEWLIVGGGAVVLGLVLAMQWRRMKRLDANVKVEVDEWVRQLEREQRQIHAATDVFRDSNEDTRVKLERLRI